ncbi:hypothetical protein [Micromonospora cathayae]|uniref:Uncharacterized protein n=1 Tax=Micromonospora cathayae TaxID=3028804 RepID=A0ABY7ZXJ5_9ACTN|nr:hypothetical protein [Micromonospora sp. HUAS 3]WDZ87799.1 hypothetical protein PVK37_16025 [Micromonospora sp. HUAS 3]
MPPVAFDRPRWWLARWVSRVFTSLAVTVALALSGGALAGNLSAWSEPVPGSVDRLVVFDPTVFGPTAFDSTAFDSTAFDPSMFDPTALRAPADPASSAGAGWSTTLDDTDRTAVPVRFPAGPGDAAPDGGATVGVAPVRPLVGTPAGAVGSRAPPPC